MRRRLLFVLALLAGTAAVASMLPAEAGSRHDRVVSANPVNWTPHVLDGIVHAITVVGDQVVVGGDFSRVSEADGSETLIRRHLFAFDRDTGEINHSFDPDVNRPVLALAPGDDGTVYAGGSFDTVNDADQAGLTRLRLSNGWRHSESRNLMAEGGEVRALARKGRWLYVGGAFKTIGGREHHALARVDTGSDTVDSRFDFDIAEQRSGRLRLEHLAISPGGTRLVFNGTFTKVAGRTRHQIAMIDTGASPPRLANWSTDAFSQRCNPRFDTYLRDIDFAPDGSYFVVVTTGRRSGGGPTCDAAVRFETRATRSDQDPTWVNYTGGDSLYAVAITGAAVYVGGHQRWLDNPEGDDDAGPGAKSRPGVGALSPRTGKALSWNPGRKPRGIGTQVLYANADGLWIGSDTEGLGGERHARLGMFPAP